MSFERTFFTCDLGESTLLNTTAIKNLFCVFWMWSIALQPSNWFIHTWQANFQELYLPSFLIIFIFIWRSSLSFWKNVLFRFLMRVGWDDQYFIHVVTSLRTEKTQEYQLHVFALGSQPVLYRSCDHSCFVFFFLPTRFPLGHVALWEPAGSGPGHLQPCPQQELQAAGLDGATQQRDQTHQQLHASGMMLGGWESRGDHTWHAGMSESIAARFIDLRLSWQFVLCLCLPSLFVYTLMCTQRDLGLCVDALGALSLQLPPTTQLHKEWEGGEAHE